MTPETLLEARAADYCWGWTAHLGGIQNALAVGCALRNRVRAGATWSEAMAQLGDHEGPTPSESNPDLREYLYRFGLLFRGDWPDITNGAKCWYDAGWWNDSYADVVAHPDAHPMTAQVGPVLFFA